MASSTTTHPIRSGADAAGRIRRRIEAPPRLRHQSPLTQPERTDEELLDSAREGDEDAQWVLLDYGDVVVHVFGPEARTFYRLERLWGDAHVVARG